MLKINRDFEQVFTELPIIAFRRNRNRQDILDKETIVNNRKQLCQNINQHGYSKPWNSKLNILCCAQVQSNNCRSTITHKTFKIYNKLNWKSKYLICVMECVLWNEQYPGKSEATINLRFNNHWKDLNKRNSLQADQHFRLPGHNFKKHAKFTLIKASKYILPPIILQTVSKIHI